MESGCGRGAGKQDCRSGRILARICAAGFFIASCLTMGAGAYAADKSDHNPTVAAADRNAKDGRKAGDARLALAELTADVTLFHAYAQTTVSLTISNPTDMLEEGDVRFIMPQGSVLTGYALDVSGVMVDGVIVEREKGEKVYEQTIRRKVDPGLARTDAPNQFHTNLYPINPGQERTVRFTYSTYLGDGRLFTLPIVGTGKVAKARLSVHLPEGGKAPALRLPKHLEGGWQVTKGGGLDGTFEGSNVHFTRPLTIKRPDGGAQTLTVADAGDGARYVEILDRLPKGEGGKPRIGTLRVYWDTSLSEGKIDHTPAIELIESLAATTFAKTVEIRPFASEAGRPGRFSGVSLSRDMRSYLEKLDYDGASNFAAAFADASGPADLCLLVSDGRRTLGAADIARAPCPLHAIALTTAANLDFLHYLTDRSQGAVHQLTKRNGGKVMSAILDPRPRLLEALPSEGLELFSAPAPQGYFRLVGRLTADTASASVTLGTATSVAERRQYDFMDVKAGRSVALRAFWARAKIADIRRQPVVDTQAIVKLSRTYGVETAETSFIVLESMVDYVRAGLVPPTTLPSFNARAYKSMLIETEAKDRKLKADRLGVITSRWRDLMGWWNHDYDTSPAFVAKRKAELSGKGGNVEALAAAPAPAQAPAAMIVAAPTQQERASEAPPADMSRSVEEVVVTGSRIADGSGGSEDNEDADVDDDASADNTVAIVPWSPDRPYLRALKPLEGDAFAREYRHQRKEHGSLPAFYFDVADLLFARGDAKAAALTALNVLDLETAGNATPMILAGKLVKYGDLERATAIYEELMRRNEMLPQPRRDLALALAAEADRLTEPAEKVRLYHRALELLHSVVMTPWQEAYDGIEMISLVEANRIAAKLRALGDAETPFPPELMTLPDVDLRVLISWNTDASDMDLWVEEPTTEICKYSNPNTPLGGHLSNDMTGGFGPEEYLLHRAADGTYKVFVHYFGSDSLRVDGPITVHVDVYRNYGRPDEVHEVTDVELSKAQGEEVNVANVTITVAPKK